MECSGLSNIRLEITIYFFYDVSLYSAAEIKCEMIIIHWPIIKCKLGVRCASFTLPDDGVLASAR